MKERTLRYDVNLPKHSECKKLDAENTVCIKEVPHEKSEKLGSENLIHTKIVPIRDRQ